MPACCSLEPSFPFPFAFLKSFYTGSGFPCPLPLPNPVVFQPNKPTSHPAFTILLPFNQMLTMPLDGKGPAAADEQHQNVQSAMESCLLFGNGRQLAAYAHGQRSAAEQQHQMPNGHAAMMAAVGGPSPLDQLIKLHERFQQGEFSTPAVATATTAAAAASLNPSSPFFPYPTISSDPFPPSKSVPRTKSNSPSAMQLPVPPLPPGPQISLSSANSFEPASHLDQFVSSAATAPSPLVCPQAALLIDPSSLVLSSAYSAAITSTPWSSSLWPWNAAMPAEQMAALPSGINSGARENAGNRQETALGLGAPGDVYFGNAFGDLVQSNLMGGIAAGETATTVMQLQPNSATLTGGTILNSTKNHLDPQQLLEKQQVEKNGISGGGNGTIAATFRRERKQRQSQNGSKAQKASNVLAALTPANTSFSSPSSSAKVGTRNNSSNNSKSMMTSAPNNRPNGGGKIRAGNCNSVSGTKNSCECPNCKELQRIGAPLDKKREKHSCHIPGCHKVYSRSSHLKAHLRWHSTDRPTTTKKRLFDPPDASPITNLLVSLKSNAVIPTKNQ